MIESQPLLPQLKHKWTPKDYLALAGSCLLLLLFGIMNNVGVSMMGYAMPAFPAWLLYGPTIIYTFGFMILAFILKDNPFRSHHFSKINQMYYLKLGVLTACNGIFVQFAIPWVDGDLSQILANCGLIQLPIFEIIYFKDRRKNYNTRQVCCLLVIIAGVMIGAFKSFIALGTAHKTQEQDNNWYWILAFFVSTTFGAWQTVYQDVAYHDSRASVTEVSSLFWLNLYSVPMYLLAILFESVPYLNGTKQGTNLADAFVNQAHAFACFFGAPYWSDTISQHGNPIACQHLADMWPWVFCGGYVGLFSVSAFMINKFGVLFPGIVSANISLAAAISSRFQLL